MAAEARVGDETVVTGARGAYRIDPAADWTLLVADATALPAVGTILDEAPADARVLLVAEVTDQAEQLEFDTAAELATVWCHRDEADAISCIPAATGARRGRSPRPRHRGGLTRSG